MAGSFTCTRHLLRLPWLVCRFVGGKEFESKIGWCRTRNPETEVTATRVDARSRALVHHKRALERHTPGSPVPQWAGLSTHQHFHESWLNSLISAIHVYCALDASTLAVSCAQTARMIHLSIGALRFITHCRQTLTLKLAQV